MQRGVKRESIRDLVPDRIHEQGEGTYEMNLRLRLCWSECEL